ncbi:IS110 family transposase [Actinospica acidithermotolerans]|uniref:IS110 family transposase n=1 Tax=Actinospica acidithermotolerans TaxID=2828514 RepID=UPI003558079B
MFSERTSVGLDVHARSVVACAIDTVTGELTRSRLTPEHAEILGWLGRLPAPVAVAYEAGPTGFALARTLRAAGVRCEVVAPSKLQRPAGDRVKTDMRDATHLARLLRLDEFTGVRVPPVVEEAARDLIRAREDVRGDLMRARHRISKLLLRRGILYSDGRTWTGRHHAWLAAQRFESVAVQAAYDAAYEAVVMAEDRRARLDRAIGSLALDPAWHPVVTRLGCLRGIDTLTALGLAVEIGDWQRFTGSSIGAYLGLVPSESSSGESRSQGSITKTGNTHARRLLVEAAWHHRPGYRPGVTLRRRWELAPAAARARGHAGNQRLHQRWLTFTEHHKRPVVADVAIARELAGWCWSLATLPD